MDKVRKWIIENGKGIWPIILLNITLTNQELIDELKTKSPEDREKIFSKFQKKEEDVSLKEKNNQYESLRPDGLDDAPQITKDYRQKLEDKGNEGDEEAVKEMKFFQWKFAYNKDWTVKLLKFKWGKTFCADLTGDWSSKTWSDANALADSKWYHLLSDWNGDWNQWYSQGQKEKTDWYTLEKYFGDYSHTWAITHMLGCAPGWYWTGTLNSWRARRRLLSETSCNGFLSDWGELAHVCGFKNGF